MTVREVKSMSRKDVTEQAKGLNLSADVGPVLKLLGDVISKEWQETNGLHLSKDERRDWGKKPLAEIPRSDIQIRVGNKLLTVVPSDENKSMVSIPVGMSDKATPATIPREWLIGMYIDALIEVCEGDTAVVSKYTESVNAAINRAMQVDETGRMKVDQSILPEPNNPIEVAEMIDSFKRTFKSKSAGSAKTHFSFDVTELEQIPDQAEEIVEEYVSPSERLLQHADTLTPMEHAEVADEVSHTSHPQSDKPVHESVPEAEPEIDVVSPSSLESIERQPQFENDGTDLPANPHNFKKNPTSWIKYQLAQDYFRAVISIQDVADLADCHVQTIKRALDKFEEEAEFVDLDGLFGNWTELGFTISETHRLLITCERSPTGRYARGKPILFTVGPKEDLPFHLVVDSTDGPVVVEAPQEVNEIPIEALMDDAPILKEVDETDPSPAVTPVDVIEDAEEMIAEEKAFAEIRQERLENDNVGDDDLLGVIMGL